MVFRALFSLAAPSLVSLALAHTLALGVVASSPRWAAQEHSSALEKTRISGELAMLLLDAHGERSPANRAQPGSRVHAEIGVLAVAAKIGDGRELAGAATCLGRRLMAPGQCGVAPFHVAPLYRPQGTSSCQH